MYFYIIIGSLFLLALLLYFILNKKIKNTSIVFDILIDQYNSKLNKVMNRVLKENIHFDIVSYKASLINKKISWAMVSENIGTIKSIEYNYDCFKKILDAQKNKAHIFLKKLKKLRPLNIFSHELDHDSDLHNILIMADFESTRLREAEQKIFGSQFFFRFGNHYIFPHSRECLIIDGFNIFNCSIEKFDLQVKLIKKNKKEGNIYALKIHFGQEQIEKQVQVIQKEGQDLLERYIK